MNPAVASILDRLGKDGVLALKPRQMAVLAEAERITALAESARPRSTVRKIHETASAALVIVALDSRFFLDNDQAMKDVSMISEGHARLVGYLSGDGPALDRASLKLFMELEFSVWNLLADRYCDREGLLA